eukprot:1471312-Amphidinium_carterae.2
MHDFRQKMGTRLRSCQLTIDPCHQHRHNCYDVYVDFLLCPVLTWIAGFSAWRGVCKYGMQLPPHKQSSNLKGVGCRWATNKRNIGLCLMLTSYLWPCQGPWLKLIQALAYSAQVRQA